MRRCNTYFCCCHWQIAKGVQVTRRHHTQSIAQVIFDIGTQVCTFSFFLSFFLWHSNTVYLRTNLTSTALFVWGCSQCALPCKSGRYVSCMFGIFVTRFAGGEPGGYLDTSESEAITSTAVSTDSLWILFDKFVSLRGNIYCWSLDLFKSWIHVSGHAEDPPVTMFLVWSTRLNSTLL